MASILIVDDNEDNLYLIDFLLKNKGHRITMARNGAEALEAAQVEPPDLIISDILMPVMDGYTLCRRWRKDERLRHIPFIFYTATYTDAKDEELALSIGADRFAIKPMQGDKFRSMIDEVLREFSAGNLKASEAEAPPDEVFLTGYNQVLIHKLEDKLVELEKANASLASMSAFRQSILDAIPALVAVLDAQGKVLAVNAAWNRFAGKESAPTVLRANPGASVLTSPGTEEASLPSGEDMKIFAGISAVLRGETPFFEMEYAVDTSDKPRWFLLRVTPMDAERAGAVVTCVDISSRKQAEEALVESERRLRQSQKLEAVGTLAGGIAHDFNNILGSIMGYAELAQMNTSKVTGEHCLDSILCAAQRAKELIRQILVFSRQTEQAFRPLHIVPLIREVQAMLRISLPPNIELRNPQPADLKPIQGDPTQIHQLIMNLTSNAAFAMKDRGGVLSISADEIILRDPLKTLTGEITPGCYVHLSIADTGTGIPPEVQQRIFDPFFTTKDEGEGTGLGLAVVHGVVRGHGGGVLVDSDASRGTTFHIYLPCLQAEVREGSAQPVKMPTGTGRLLFVEDDRPLLELGDEVLTSLGYSVAAYAGSTEALRAFEANPASFDLVITDHMMPVMTGKSLARKIKAIRPDIPVILYSGSLEFAREKQAPLEGIDAVLTKPLNLNELARVVKTVIENGGSISETSPHPADLPGQV